ncbi:SusC/RagA family TonB-linked outer membrane protein [Chitinophaga sp. Cy-1792]|uniref:SusC/RagA family TonB-linked outer membrane protein n=1 Tax=Chitinophaga sp. Cy-1792 TaxID=2608339 RepID=UPI001423F63B|nr:SusC/RagA family TonB-linked outer membrane protein [Chitinophaga sp. Cy-1792]NIG57486.1 SusC/RagA family TonB-linked outer membrane protein [Chitinophaga sp. Cy-1792]
MKHIYKKKQLLRWCLTVITAAAAATPGMAQDSSQITRILRKDSTWFAQPTYGWNKTSTRANTVAAVGTIYSNDVNSTPVANITNVLAGRLAGLGTAQSTGLAGTDAATLGLRGRTPLIVIDGVVRDFTGFNPSDIESVTLLKDALATAMYGQRSSNGVLLITTKSKGRKSFELNVGAQKGILDPLYRPKFLNSYDYATLYNEAQQNTTPGSTPRYSADQLNAWKNHTNDPYTQPDVNWMDEIVKKQTQQQRYNIDLAGTAKNYHYFASLEHFSQSGNFVTSPNNSYNTNNDYKRYNIRTNAAVQFNKDIELSLNVFGSLETRNQPGVLSQGVMAQIAATAPNAFPIYNKNGSFASTNEYVFNPYAGAVSTGYIPNTQRTIAADMALQYKLDDLVKGLWVKGQLSMNNSYSEYIDRSKSYATFSPDTSAGAAPGSYIQYATNGVVGAGTAFVAQQGRQNYYNLMAGYDRSWNEHTLNVLATYNVDNNIISFYQLNRVYTNFGINASYDWKKTYFAEVSMTESALNRYQPGHRYTFLPTAGLGWVISNENFFNSQLISRLKLRASVGQTAWGDPDGYYPYMTNYTVDTTGYNVGETPSGIGGIAKKQVGNINYTWEKGLKMDIGLEAAFLHDQLSVTVDYYRNKLYDLLQTRSRNTGIFGQPYPVENIGSNRYSGVEAAINWAPVSHSNFKYYINGTFAAAYSKVLSSGDPAYPYPWQYRTGKAVGSLFGLVADGFYDSKTDISKTANYQGYTPVAGDIKYKDLNGDGVINVLDMTAISNQKPEIYFGISGGFTWKSFDFKALVQGNVNRLVAFNPATLMPFGSNINNNAQAMHLDRWTSDNSVNASFPRLTLGSNVNNNQISTFWQRNADYVRLKNVEIGYDFKKLLFTHSKINQLRFFVNAYNLITISKVKDIDPESYYNAFSNQRIINGGITLGL